MNSLASPVSKNELNSAKGLGIIIVVLGHISFPVFSVTHVYMYHMPLFFFLSGMSLNDSRKIKDSVSFDFINILLYAAAMTFLYSVVGKLVFWKFGLKFVTFQGFGIENYTVKILTENSHHVLFFLVGWFLVALFFARTFAMAAVKAFKALPAPLFSPALLVAAILLCYVGMTHLAEAFHATRNPYINAVAQVAVATGFLLIGHWVVLCRPLLQIVRNPLMGFLLAIALYESAVFLGAKPLSMAWSEYPAGFWRHMLGALLGIFLVLNISFAAAKLSPDNLLCFIGKRSKTVMSHHLFTFFLVNIGLAYFGLVALQDIGIWYSLRPDVTWPVYVGLGVAVPILVEEVRLRAFDAVRNRARVWRGKRGADRLGDRSSAGATNGD